MASWRKQPEKVIAALLGEAVAEVEEKAAAERRWSDQRNAAKHAKRAAARAASGVVEDDPAKVIASLLDELVAEVCLHLVALCNICIFCILRVFASRCIMQYLHFLHFARDCISLHYAFGGQLHFSCICFFCILCIRRETAFSCMDSLTHGLHCVCT